MVNLEYQFNGLRCTKEIGRAHLPVCPWEHGKGWLTHWKRTALSVDNVIASSGGLDGRYGNEERTFSLLLSCHSPSLFRFFCPPAMLSWNLRNSEPTGISSSLTCFSYRIRTAMEGPLYILGEQKPHVYGLLRLIWNSTFVHSKQDQKPSTC